MSTWPLDRLARQMQVDFRDGAIARNLLGAAIGGLLIGALEFAYTRASANLSPVLQLGWLARLSVHWVLAALPLGLLLGVAEHRAAPRGPTRTTYVACVLAGAAFGGVILALHGKYVDPSIAATSVGFDLSLVDRFLYGVWQLSFWGAVGAALHATESQQRRSAHALHDGELARLRTERALAEVRLAAIHARVEPEFVLRCLDAIERLYARDVAGADRVLDALIQFLREATPLLRQSESTLARECRLLDSYWRVLGTATATHAHLCVDAAADTWDAWLPPGLLLSLVQRVIDVQPTATVVIEARRREGDRTTTLRVRVDAASTACTQSLQEFATRAQPRLTSPRGDRGAIDLLPEGRSLVARITFETNTEGASP